MSLIFDVLLDSVIDTLKLVPFLFVTYLVMEALEHGAQARTEAVVSGSGKAGPIVGSVLGAIPQCGFSAMAATLYAGRVVTAGTLVAVILSTSDEMLPVFLAHQVATRSMLSIILLKVAVGVVAGFALDAALYFLHRDGDGKARISELCERAGCHCEDDLDGHQDGDHHDHEHHHHKPGIAGIARSAVVHTVQVAGFIFLITFVFGLVIEAVGQQAIGAFMAAHPMLSTFAAGVIGLIPNCGASVAITELYLSGVLSSGAMVAGLLVSGGVGILVLFRTNESLRENVQITAFVYLVGVLCGLAVSYLGVSF